MTDEQDGTRSGAPDGGGLHASGGVPLPPAVPLPGAAPAAPPVPPAPPAPPVAQPYAPPVPPYAGPVPPYAGPVPPYAAPAGAFPQASPPSKRLSTGAVIGIVGGAVAAIVVVGLILGGLFLPRGGVLHDGGSGSGAAAASAVQHYLEAVADADAETARSFLGPIDGDDALLTDEVLAASSKLAALEDIAVEEPAEPEYFGEVSATYTLGGESVSARFTVSDVDADGEWTVDIGTTPLLIDDRLAGLGLAVNGVPLTTTGDEVALFPGTYELGIDSTTLILSGATTVVATEPGYPLDTFDLDVALSDEGAAAVRAAVDESLAACLAATTLDAGCGLAVPPTLSDGTIMVEGTISRTLSAESRAKLDAMTYEPSNEFPRIVRGDFVGGVSIEGDCEKDGSRGRCTVLFGPSLGTPTADLSKDPIVVTWE